MSFLYVFFLMGFAMVVSSFVTFMVMDMKGFMKMMDARHKAHLAHIDSLGRVANALNQCRVDNDSIDDTDERVHNALIKEILSVGQEAVESKISKG